MTNGRPRGRRIRFIALYGLYVTALAGIASALVMKLRFDVPLTGERDARSIWTYYYPELAEIWDQEIRSDDERLDILLLGASVLEQTAAEIERHLRDRLGGDVRVVNLARQAHTSRDSYLKFERLHAKRFDLIVIYHGINDARMNCASDEDFRADYTHCGWYYGMQRRLVAGKLTMAYVLTDHLDRLIGLGEPEAPMRTLGESIKTERPFRDNLEAIVATAQSHRQPVVLMSFAVHLPADYTREKFTNGELDYGPGGYKLTAEAWGEAANVSSAVDVHNAVVRDLAASYDNVVFVDQEHLLAKDGVRFSDPCHLTETGQAEFVGNLIPAIVSGLRGASRAAR